jgi:Ca2+-binding RTX toxin-like protein
MSGNEGGNVLNGLGGADNLDGRGGNDLLLGGEGDDLFFGGAGADTMSGGGGAALRFGEWSRILVGQINRKHYYFVVDRRNRICGFVGWALATTDKAEEWVQGRGALSYQDSLDGNCILFNAWAADTKAVNRFLLAEGRRLMIGKDWVYFKRHYKDGNTRPNRLRVNDFVAQHLGQSRATAANS